MHTISRKNEIKMESVCASFVVQASHLDKMQQWHLIFFHSAHNNFALLWMQVRGIRRDGTGTGHGKVQTGVFS